MASTSPNMTTSYATSICQVGSSCKFTILIDNCNLAPTPAQHISCRAFSPQQCQAPGRAQCELRHLCVPDCAASLLCVCVCVQDTILCLLVSVARHIPALNTARNAR